MPYQSEAALEKQLLETLQASGYEPVAIADTDDLERNFRRQLERHNGITCTDEEFQKIRNHLDGGSFFEKSRKLRDRFELERPEGTRYVEFINMDKWCQNVFQVTHQITNRSNR